MKQGRREECTQKLSLALLWPAIALLFYCQPVLALGPNLMVNNSFEGGDHAYWKADVAPFSIVKDPANAHTGSRALQVKVQPWGSCNLRDMGTHINNEMPGHPGHPEMIENDVIEMSHQWGGEAGQHISGFGEWCDKGSIGDANTQFPPVGTDYGQYHTYGCLLVPATAANDWNGYRTVFFDGAPMISTCWVGNQTYKGVFPETRESMGSYRFSRIDQAWEVLIIGNGQGGVSPMDVQYVRVYGVSKSSLKVSRGAAPAPPKGLRAN
jgi:hypothetical protein